MFSSRTTATFGLALGLALATATTAFATRAFAADGPTGAAASQGDAAEKEAFESAKSLGTAEAWQAFLSHYSSGFRADLARAYLVRLNAQPAQPAAAPPAPPQQTYAPAPAASGTVTRVRHPGGEFNKSGATRWAEHGPSGRAIFSFEEIARTAQGIELYDASRGVYITLDVASRIIWYKDANSPRTRLYDIVEAGGGHASAPAPQAYPAALHALPPARELSCRQQSSIASSNSNTPAKVTFINDSGIHRAVLWIDFNGRTKSYAALNAGEQVTLDTYLTHPWLITDGPGDCIKIVLPEPGESVAYLSGGGHSAPASVPRRTEPTYFTTRPKPKYTASPSYCGGGKVRVNGKCMRRADAAAHCGPGYRPQGGKCVQGYRAPKPSDGLSTEQKKAVGLGCPRGQVWSALEGCHEDD